ncbi:MAG: hypothetical protein J6Q54_00580, partial [Oscillospiraceae bacterium]|nr:hypothetical protein [Oscillospiraceae bacterium]
MKTLRNLVVLVILAALLTMPAAAASGKAVMEPLQVEAQAGETFTVTVSLADAGNINVGTVALTYDANVFTMVGGKCLIEGTMFAQVMPDKNAGTFLLATPKVISGDIFVFEFVVNSGAASGQYAL